MKYQNLTTLIIISLISVKSIRIRNHQRYRSIITMGAKRKISSNSNINVIKVETDTKINEKKTKKKIKISNNNTDVQLLDLGDLVEAVVIRRPSASIKSPYVADVVELTNKDCKHSFPLLLIDDDDADAENNNGDAKKLKKKVKIDHNMISEKVFNLTKTSLNEVQLAHAPSLDCAGMVVSGCKVHCKKQQSSSGKSPTKTSMSIQLCEEIRESGTVIVGYHPNLAEKLALELVNNGLLKDVVGEYDIVSSQVTFGKSRVDFVLTNSQAKSKILLEVKNVVGADYPINLVPKNRNKVGVYETTENIRSAIFPHGSKKSGIEVVSDRAIKHVHELTELMNTKDENNFDVKSAILFVVNRSDCNQFRPLHEADMLFAQVLYKAFKSGVMLIVQEIIWDKSIAKVGRRLPIHFNEEIISKDIDDTFLQKVLEYNETFKR